MNRRIVVSGTLAASLVCALCFAQVKGGGYVRQTQTRSQTQVQIQTNDARVEAPVVAQTSSDADITSQFYGPVANWKVGDSWIVETRSLEEQGDAKGFWSAVRWVFTVTRVVSVLGKSSFEVSIFNQDRTSSDPTFYMYVDLHTGALIRTTNSVWRFGTWRTRTENFASNDGEPTAAIVPSVPAVPVDMPVFPEASAKGLDFGSGVLVVSSETPEDSLAKSVSNVVPFACRVAQRIGPITQESDAELVAKGFDSQTFENGVEVEIETTTGRTVKQIWNSGAPWPIYATNGVVEARLIIEK